MVIVQASYGFGQGASGTALLDSGWEAPAADGVWTSGAESVLTIPVSPAPGALALELALDPQEIYGITRPCEVTLLSDGVTLATRILGGKGRWVVPIRDSEGPTLRLTLRAAPYAHGIRLSELLVLRDTHAPRPKPARALAEYRFGWNETTQHLVPPENGWGTPEDGYVWAIGGLSTLHLPVAPNGAPVTAVLDMRPNTRSGAPELQRVIVTADGTPVATLSLWERLSVAIDLHPARGQAFVALSFQQPDADFATSDPYHHFGKPFAWALASARIVPALPRYLPSHRPRVPGGMADGSMQAMVHRLTGQTAGAIAALYEGLGNGCELGLLQQAIAEDRSGLLRFSAIRQRELVEGLFAAFHGVARRDRLMFEVRRQEDDTWRLIEGGGYELSSATPHDRSMPPPRQALDVLARRLPRLADKLMEDVAAGDRIFLMRFSEAGGEEAARAVLAALRHHGDAEMVWLVIDETRQTGSVERLESGLIRGYVDVPTPGRDASPDTMLSILANAWVLLQQAVRLQA
jgi:hypothetical protein